MNTNQKTETRDWRWRNSALVAIAGVSMLAACSDATKVPTGRNGSNRPSVTTQYTLTPAANCQTVKQRLIEVAVEQTLQNRYDDQGLEFAVDENNANNVNNSDSSSGNDQASPTDYTTTNVQEAGVDEADFLKTDGDYIYALYGSDLVILKSWPAEQTSEIARISLGGEQGYPTGIFLKGDKIGAFMSIWEDTDDNDGVWERSDFFQGTRVSIIDVSDRTAPRIERNIDIESNYNDARMIDGDVYLVTQGRFELPNEISNIAWDDTLGLPDAEWEADETRREQLKGLARPIVLAEITRILSGTDVNDLFPTKRVLNSSGDVLANSQLYQCNELYLPQQLAQLGLLNITHFDLDDKTPITTTGVLANGWEVYASGDNLYVSMSSNWWWWGWGGAQNQETIIHKFSLNGANDKPVYAASGKVDGWLQSQFSMSEYQDHLRVATTDNQWTWDETTGESIVTGGNHLFVLKDQQGELKETGSVRDLAPGEQIFAMRMIGPKGYMVTFEQTDPLFTFDLSDPNNPRLMGELKINGFSSYIHPLGDNHLLTIGQDADSQGIVNGVHLQIFDVSDLNNPVRVQQHKISTGQWSSWSEAMWEHKAFTYHPDKKILAVPVNIYEWEQNNAQNFSGLLILKVDETAGFTEIGRVNHADLAAQYYCRDYDASSYECQNGEYQWWTSVRRSIFIEDYVFSFSTLGLKVNDLLDARNEHVKMTLLEDEYYF